MKNCLGLVWLVLYVTMGNLSDTMAETWQLRITLKDNALAGTRLSVRAKLHGSLGVSDYINIGPIVNPSPDDIPPVIFEKILNSSIQIGRLSAVGIHMNDESDPILAMQIELSNSITTYVLERETGFIISQVRNYNLKTWTVSWDDCREGKFSKMNDKKLGTLISSFGKINKFDCGSACTMEKNCHAYRMHANMCELYSDAQSVLRPAPYEYYKLSYLRRYDRCMGR